jgi:hypothetical protein
MGHISLEVVRKLVENGVVEGVMLDKLSNIQSCNSCEYAKAHRKPIRKEQDAPRATALGDEVHSDLWGPAPIQTINGRRYYTSFTDDHTRYSHLYLLRAKDETLDAYKTYEAELLTQRKA